MLVCFINVVKYCVIIRIIYKAITFFIALRTVIAAFGRDLGSYWIECRKIFIVPICDMFHIKNLTSIFMSNLAYYGLFYLSWYVRFISA